MLARLMMARTTPRALALALGVALGLAAACSDPCTELAKQTCECKRNEGEKQACIQEVETRAKSDNPSAPAEKCCDALTDRCTCAALARGELAACGLVEPENASDDEWGDGGAPSACVD
ncbi:MAG: hypothetical protein HYZ27_07755 [Deltaproteobacteria bacterium]|nr:hypothetical protein [Deltaproteobacteria bacterium]